MNLRRPKIWQTEDQILASIDRTKRMAERLLKKSHKLDEQCKQTYGHLEELRFEAMKPHDSKESARLCNQIASVENMAISHREKADACAKSYHRAINATLPRLGEILAAFRTQTLPEVMGSYRGVSVR